ncbi:MAG: PDDEXK nuclease domain-containing protein [Flavobacteriaceae bacterium]|jgi:predicted nuclease of restriction endonuclease-like (RecB) superfamily|nr:PDDEXK nuclease domain-containing protein [Flavobacteriaceae bacterium]
MAENEHTPVRINALYDTISQIIEKARNTVYRAANFAMVQAYWNIGRAIVEEEQNGKERADYGTELITQLAKKLTKKHGKNFSERNLWYIKQFYQKWTILNAVRSELSWTHYRLLLRVENDNARQFYMQEAIDCNWSTRSLERQINNLYYERILMSKDSEVVKSEAIEKTNQQEPQDIIKDPYVLEFLGLKDNIDFRESELEQAIINKLHDFLLELGKGFAFVGRQYRLTTETGKHFYADLVFYNYLLKCFLIIDLKTTELTHQDIGQMDMYVRYFEDKIRQENDNPTIGLILCTKKDNTVVKYSLLNDSKQIFASKYMTYMPTEQELKKEIERERRQIEQEKNLNSM